jgi:hypothetical protein
MPGVVEVPEAGYATLLQTLSQLVTIALIAAAFCE